MEEMTEDIIVADLETTNLDRAFGEICEISFQYVRLTKIEGTANFDYKVLGKFHSLVQPSKMSRISEEALSVNGLSKTMLLDAPLPTEVRGAFVEWWREIVGVKLPILGQNFGMFDSHFLVRFMPTLLDSMFDYHSIDTWSIAFALQKVGLIPKEIKLNLEGLTEYFNIPHYSHSAEGDTSSTLVLYIKLLSLMGRLS